MSGQAEHGRMEMIDNTIDVEELIREIERYLAVVEVFRAEGCKVGGRRHRERSKDER